MASRCKYSFVGLWTYAHLMMCRSHLSTTALQVLESSFFSTLIPVIDIALAPFLRRKFLWRPRSVVCADYRRSGFGGDDDGQE